MLCTLLSIKSRGVVYEMIEKIQGTGTSHAEGAIYEIIGNMLAVVMPGCETYER